MPFPEPVRLIKGLFLFLISCPHVRQECLTYFRSLSGMIIIRPPISFSSISSFLLFISLFLSFFIRCSMLDVRCSMFIPSCMIIISRCIRGTRETVFLSTFEVLGTLYGFVGFRSGSEDPVL